jgi:thimet oligopeptidase
MRLIDSQLVLWVLIALTGCTGNRIIQPSMSLGELGLKGNRTMIDAPWKTAADLTTFCDSTLADSETIRQALKSPDCPASFEGTLAPYNQMLMVTDTAMGWASLMFQVHPDETIRTAAGACKQKLAAFGNEVALDKDIYEQIDSVDLSKFDDQTARYVGRILREFRRSGVDKDDATRERLKTIYSSMVELGQTYQKNVLADVRQIEIHDRNILEGLPTDWIAAHTPKEDSAPIIVTTDYPDFIPFQSYCKDEPTRKALYSEFMRRGFPQNEKVLKDLLMLRHEYANILGHSTWASYNAEDKMAKTSERIDSFIRELETIVRPVAKKDLAKLLVRKQKDVPNATEIAVWDRFYYAGKVREEQYQFDARALRPYFPYARVKEGIMALYAELFDIGFERLDDTPVWHEAVEAYALTIDGKRAATFFLDMHPRAGKYKHAAMFGIQTGLQGGRLPMASLVCNFPSPAEGGGQMEHSQVETFFHEFGHLLHHLLAKDARYTNLGGINVEWDFVEAPSQILEEWAWTTDVLQRFARHVETDEPVPAALIERMRASEEFGKGADIMRQLFYTAYSYYLHAQDPKDLDLEQYSAQIYRDYSPYARLEGGKVFANFGHLIGYSSMYYTYQWSLVIAKDLFTRFQTAGMMDSKTAIDYRRFILEPGGMRDANDLVRDFLGRDYNLDAYKAWLQN